MPKVAVIMPVYNPEPSFLDEAVTSVLKQSFNDWELLLVDDGSTQSPVDMNCYTDPRIRVFKNLHRGLSATRNFAIAQSKSELVAFLDCDDLWNPRKLERQVELFTRQPEARWCSTDFERIDEKGKLIGKGYEGFRSSYEELLQGCGICISTVMLRREAFDSVGSFDTQLPAAEDYDLWLRLSRRYAPVHLDEVLTRYREHSQAISRNYERTFRCVQEILERQADSVSADPHYVRALERGRSLWKKRFSAQAFDVARQSYRRKNIPLMFKSLTHSLVWDPKGFLSQALRKVRAP